MLSNGARFRDLRLSIQIMIDQIQLNDSLKAGLGAVKSVRVGVPHYLRVVAIYLFPRTAGKGPLLEPSHWQVINALPSMHCLCRHYSVGM